MNAILVSVIIPVYNAEKYVRRAAESVLKQPLAKHLELILVDDGSTDQSGRICDEIAADPAAAAKVRVFHQINQGVSAARNLGITNAKGRYVGFLDADDWWMPGFFDSDLAGMLEDGFDMYQFSHLSTSPDRRWYKAHRVQESEQLDLEPDSGRPYPVLHGSCLYRREFILRHQITYPPCRIMEDMPFVHLATSLAQSIQSIDREMFAYWVNAQSSTHSSKIQNTLKEEMKSLALEEAAFREKGLPLSNQRAGLSVIMTRLPALCCAMPYRSLKAYLNAKEFALLRQPDLEPWDDLQNRARLFRKHPFVFWLKSRLCTGLPMWIRNTMRKVPFLRRFIDFVQYRLILKWQPASKVISSSMCEKE